VKKKQITNQPSTDYELQVISSKLRCLGYFYDQMDANAPVIPLDMDNVFAGISALLTELSEEVRKIAIRVGGETEPEVKKRR